MASRRKAQQVSPTLLGRIDSLLYLAGSLKLAVILLVVLVVVLAWATFLESDRGTEYTQWHVYDATWFIVLCGLLGANVLAATVARFPWRLRQLGFVITHAGVVAILLGSIVTFWMGIEGQLALVEGESGDTILITDCSQLSILQDGEKSEERFTFYPGPVDWTQGHTLDFPRPKDESDGVGIKVLKFYRHARMETGWVADESRQGGPALKFALLGPGQQPVAEDWLTTGQFGGEATAGPIKFTLLPVPAATMVEDFLRPPAAGRESDGVLSIHYQGRMRRVKVRDNLGKKISIGAEGSSAPVSVEIVEFLPNAKPAAGGRFVSQGDEPTNPMLELRVHLPGQEEPIRQIAFAKLPLLNFDRMHGRSLPVKFWYHYPAASVGSAVEFLQTPDGKLCCRVGSGGSYLPRGEVNAGDRVDVAAGFAVKILSYLRHARKEVTFRPMELAEGEKSRTEAAALVEISMQGATRKIWLRRNDEQYGVQRFQTPKGTLALAFGYEQLALGFKLKLLDFKRGLNPGRMGNASFASSVQLIDEHAGIDKKQEISMNRPLEHGKFTFYQSSYQESPDGREASVLSAAYDPGRLLKYLGSLMSCVGILVILCQRCATLWRKRAPGANAGANGGKSLAGGAVAALILLPAIGFSASAAQGAADTFNWDQWQYLSVLSGGRHKPLDTFARETLLALSNRTRFADPKTGENLTPAASYLAMLFDWQGWDRLPQPERMATMSTHAVYFASHKADKWDRAPMFPVDSRELREALNMAKAQDYISPLELSEALIKDPKSGDRTPFPPWAGKLRSSKQQGLTTFEEEALNLFATFRAYQNHRMGNGLLLLPIRGREDHQWASVAQLMITDLDEGIDPTGVMQEVKQQFQSCRAAYLDGSAKEFNRASAALLDAARRGGPKLGLYPSQRKIELEVSYNNWVPFRFAWIFSLAAFVFLLPSMLTGWKPLYFSGILALGLSLAVALVGFWMRAVIRGWAPVTNMYETVVYMALGVVVFGMIFEIFSRRRYIITAAAAIATLTLLLADFCADVLDPSIRPLPPVLRSNYWLVIHVMTIMLSYAAFALSMAVGNITLGFYLAGSRSRDAIRTLSRFNYLLLLIGILLLVVGTILGALWADYSWGRFWSWDAKEVWALITLLGYAAILHARFVPGWMGNLGMAASSVLCFLLVVMAWYGVNFILGTGLHSYGTGAGGKIYVLGAAAIQLIYLAAAVVVGLLARPAAEHIDQALRP